MFSSSVYFFPPAGGIAALPPFSRASPASFAPENERLGPSVVLHPHTPPSRRRNAESKPKGNDSERCRGGRVGEAKKKYGRLRECDGEGGREWATETASNDERKTMAGGRGAFGARQREIGKSVSMLAPAISVLYVLRRVKCDLGHGHLTSSSTTACTAQKLSRVRTVFWRISAPPRSTVYSTTSQFILLRCFFLPLLFGLSSPPSIRFTLGLFYVIEIWL